MATNDPQSKRKRTWGEWFGGTKEGNAIASAEYKRGMGINPKAKDISNAEASRSARSMANPTSAPARTFGSGEKSAKQKTSKVYPSSTGKTDNPYFLGGPKRAAKAKIARTRNEITVAKVKADSPSPSVATPVKPADTPKKVATPKAKPVKASSVKAGPAKVAAAKPSRMNAFERQKMRQLEKEGWGGRSMTSSQAKSRVETERGYKTPSIKGLSFGRKSEAKPASKPKGKPLSSSTFASKLQGRNVKGSPTYSPSSGTKKKSGFKFKDLFNK